MLLQVEEQKYWGCDGKEEHVDLRVWYKEKKEWSEERWQESGRESTWQQENEWKRPWVIRRMEQERMVIHFYRDTEAPNEYELKNDIK